MPEGPEPTEPIPQRREERGEGGALLAEWFVVADPGGTETRHGKFVAYHKNGQRREQGFYDRGKPAGIWIGWAEDGRQLYDKRHDGDGEATPEVPEPTPEDWEEPALPDLPKPTTDKFALFIEVVVVLCLGWVPYMTNAAVSWGALAEAEAALAAGEGKVIHDEWGSLLTEFASAGGSIGILVPLLWIIYRSGSTWAFFGIRRPKLLRDGAGGILLLAICAGVELAYETVVGEAELVSTLYIPERAAGWTVLSIALILNSLAEEFVFRGVLQHQFSRLTGSLPISIGVCSALFASYHIYQGPRALIPVALLAVILGAWTAVSRSIWPAVIAHTGFNLWVWISAALEYRPGA